MAPPLEIKDYLLRVLGEHEEELAKADKELRRVSILHTLHAKRVAALREAVEDMKALEEQP